MGVRNVRGGGDRCGDDSGDVPEKADEERWVSRCRLDGSGSDLVILDLMEGTHPGAEQCDAGSPIHCAFEHF